MKQYCKYDISLLFILSVLFLVPNISQCLTSDLIPTRSSSRLESCLTYPEPCGRLFPLRGETGCCRNVSTRSYLSPHNDKTHKTACGCIYSVRYLLQQHICTYGCIYMLDVREEHSWGKLFIPFILNSQNCPEGIFYIFDRK